MIEQGVKRHDRVGIYLHKCLELPIALYGILKTGAAYVPLDPEAPPARLRAMVDDCGIRHIVSQPSKVKQVDDLVRAGATIEFVVGQPTRNEGPLVSVPWADVFALGGTTAPDVKILQEDLAYVIYTSGSTGTPKGIMHCHRSGLAYAKLSASTYGLRPDDRMSNHPPLHSDMSTFEFLAGPYVGASTILIPEDYTKLPASLTQLVADEGNYRLVFRGLGVSADVHPRRAGSS